MRTYRSLILFVALVCTGIACKKEGSSLKKENDLKNVSEISAAAAGNQQAQAAAEFKSATGLNIVDQIPINPEDRVVLNSSQDAIDFFNSLSNGNAAPISLETIPSNLPLPEDDQNCYTCKKVKVIASIPFHASVLIGILQFKRLTSDLQYSFIGDSWTLTGIHFFLNSSSPITVNMMSTTKFTFEKQMEYYIGIRFKGFDFTVSFPFWISGNGDVLVEWALGRVVPIWGR